MRLFLKEDTKLHQNYVLTKPDFDASALITTQKKIRNNFAQDLKRKIDVAKRILNLIENKNNIAPEKFRKEILDLFDVSGYDDESLFKILGDTYGKKYVGYSEITYLLPKYTQDELFYSHRWQEHVTIGSWNDYLYGDTIIISSDVKVPIEEYTIDELKKLIDKKDIISIKRNYHGEVIDISNYNHKKKRYKGEDAEYLKGLKPVSLDYKNIFYLEEFASASTKYINSDVTINILIRTISIYLSELLRELNKIGESSKSTNYQEKETAIEAIEIIISSKVLDEIQSLSLITKRLIKNVEAFTFINGYLYNLADRVYFQNHNHHQNLDKKYLESVSSDFEIIRKLEREYDNDCYIVRDNSKLLEDIVTAPNQSPKRKLGIYEIVDGKVKRVILPSVYDNIHYYGDDCVIVEYNKLYAYIYFGIYSSKLGQPITPLIVESASPFNIKYPGFAECTIDGNTGFIPFPMSPYEILNKDNLLTEKEVKSLLFSIANYDKLTNLKNFLEKSIQHEDIKIKQLTY